MNALDLRKFDDAVYPVELSRQAYKFWLFLKTSILLLSSQKILKEAITFILQEKKLWYDWARLSWLFNTRITLRFFMTINAWTTEQTHHSIVLAGSLSLQNSFRTENVSMVLHRIFFYHNYPFSVLIDDENKHLIMNY